MMHSWLNQISFKLLIGDYFFVFPETQLCFCKNCGGIGIYTDGNPDVHMICDKCKVEIKILRKVLLDSLGDDSSE